MLRRLLIFALVLLSATFALSGELLDRVVATVNGRPILQSDLADELRFEAFMSAERLDQLSSADLKSALDRLIDQELINGQARPGDLKPISPAEVDSKIEALKARYSKTDPQPSWSAALARYGLTEDLIRKHVTLELNQLAIVDARLRPSIQIDPQAVRTYYEQKLLPSLPPGQHVTLQQATPQIHELLVQQKINQQLDSWLDSLRAQAEIHRFDEPAPASPVSPADGAKQ